MASTYEQIPGEDGWPIVGSIPRFMRKPLAFLSQLQRDHGRVARFRMADLDYVLLTDPGGIEQVLVTRHGSFEKHEFLRATLGDVVGDGLLVAGGEPWRKQRQLAQPDFRPERLHDYGAAMVDHTDDLLDRWRKEPKRELYEDTSQLTLQIVAETLFGADVREEAATIGSAMDDVMARFRANRRLLMLVPRSWPLPVNRRYQRGVATLHGVVDQLIDDHEPDPGRVDLMSRLIDAYAEAGRDRKTLRDELVTFLIAGHETTALALTWTAWLLATHPDVQARLADTIATELEGNRPTPADVQDLELLDAVVDEAMRLYPPVWAFGREAVEDVEIAGRELPAGTQVMMSQWVVHRDPSIWQDPEAFDPQRWLDGRSDDKPGFAHFPFGGGPRRCIGDRFAMLEIRLCLARLLQQARWQASTQRPGTEPSLTLRPAGPIHVRAEERA